MPKRKRDAFEEWAAALVQWTPPGTAEESGQSEADGWAASAKWFRAMRESFDAEHDPFLAFLAPWLTPNSTVLDIGAGTGRLSLPIATKVRRVTAVEASPAMAAALEEGIIARGIRNVVVVRGRWPAVHVERADAVICANVLYDVADLKPFLIKLDAVACRACFIYLTARHPYASFRDLWKEFRGWDVPTKPTYEDAVRCLKQLGIKPRVEIMQSQPLSFADLEQAVAFAQRRLMLRDDPDLLRQLHDYIAHGGEQKNGRWFPGWGGRQSVVLWWEKIAPEGTPAN